MKKNLNLKKHEDFLYEIVNSSSDSNQDFIKIVRYIGTEKHIIFPDEICGFPVKALDTPLIEQPHDIESIKLPKYLETLGKTFKSWKNLKTVQFPPALLTIEAQAFQYCVKLQNLIFPERLQYIGKEAFSCCRKIDQIEFLGTCDYIYELAFEDCTDLEQVKSKSYFSKELAPNVFKFCPNLPYVDGFLIVDHILCDYNGEDTTVHIPEGVQVLADDLFQDKLIKEVIMPNSILHLSKALFKDMEHLESIHFSDNITEIPEQIFENCAKLQSIILPNSLETIGAGAFMNCQSLKEIIFNQNLKIIEKWAFYHCNNLTALIFPEGLIEIRTSAFQQCTSVETLHFPKSLNFIGKSAFDGFKNLTDIHFSHEETDFLQLVIDKNAVNFGRKYIPIQDHILPKFEKKFQNAYRIKQIKNSELLSAQDYEGLLELISKRKPMRENLVKHGSPRLISDFFQKNYFVALDEIESYLDKSIADGTSSLTAVLLDYKEKRFTREQQDTFQTNRDLIEIGLEFPTLKQIRENWAVLSEDDYFVISAYKGKSKSATVPSGVQKNKSITVLGAGRRYRFEQLESVHLEEGITKIADFTFTSSPLQQVHLPNTLKTIGKDAFANSDLKEISFPNGLETIDERAFYETNMTEVILPNTVTFLGEEAFFRNLMLKTVKLPDNLDVIEDCTFEDAFVLDDLTLPKNLKIIGENAFHRCCLLETIEFPASLEEIHEGAFTDCHKLKRIIFSSNTSMLNIKERAFSLCSELEEITLPQGLTKLSKSLFSSCSKLKRVILPETIEKVNSEAFYHCNELEYVGYGDERNFVNEIFEKLQIIQSIP